MPRRGPSTFSPACLLVCIARSCACSGWAVREKCYACRAGTARESVAGGRRFDLSHDPQDIAAPDLGNIGFAIPGRHQGRGDPGQGADVVQSSHPAAAYRYRGVGVGDVSHAAAGTLKQLDPKIVAKRPLAFLAHGLGAYDGPPLESLELFTTKSGAAGSGAPARAARVTRKTKIGRAHV